MFQLSIMRFVRQPTAIDIVNIEEHEQTENKKHGDLLPNTIRAVLAGPSNCGKTTALFSLITSEYGLCFENIYVYSKSLNQLKYRYLAEVFKGLKEIGFYTYCNNEEILPPNEVKKNSIFVFDDVSCDRQNMIKEYFSRGRHNQTDCFYLCQSYSQIPKHLIRDNCNFLILFKQDDLNLRNIYKSHVNTDMSFEKFRNLCSECWKDGEHNFLVIDKDSRMDSGRYRKGFNEFAIP